MTRDDRLVALDLAVLAAALAAILVAADRLAVMSAVIPALIAVRFALLRRLDPRPLWPELLLFAGLTVLGALNDWNTVVRHGVYAYTVPADHPALSTIPTWMLLAWGLILRAVVRLARWPRLGPDRPAPPTARLLLGLGLILATRLALYALFRDPWWSWLPFALALAVHLALVRPAPRARLLAAIALFGGSLVEAVLIHVAGLHHYQLGWLAGVPVWIALWWALGVLVLAELAPRVEDGLARIVGARSG